MHETIIAFIKDGKVALAEPVTNHFTVQLLTPGIDYMCHYSKLWEAEKHYYSLIDYLKDREGDPS